MKKNCSWQELQYSVYQYSLPELVSAAAKSILLVLFFALFFYRSLWAVLPLSPLFVLTWKGIKKEKIKNRREELKIEFKDCLQAVCAAMKAGYSVENAFRESISDMQLLYGKEGLMVRELQYIMQGLQNHISLEQLLGSLGERSGVQDIREFGEVFAIAKRSGGSMTDMLVKTAGMIAEKMEIDREIQVLLSAKKMEQKIMNVIPFAIVFYISLTSPGFFDILYHNPLGIIIMSICLLVYLAAFYLSTQIMEIEIE